MDIGIKMDKTNVWGKEAMDKADMKHLMLSVL